MFTRTSTLATVLSASALILGSAAFLTAQNNAKQSAPPAQPAQRGPTFRTGTRLVVVDVVVSNDGGPIQGLTKDDFILEDKGKKQEIAVFSSTALNKGAAAQPLPPGIVSNKMNAKGEEFQSATVVLYDRANTAAVDQAFVRAQVLKILASLKPTDKVGFYFIGSTTVGSALSIVSDFNNDAAPLVEAAKRLEGSNPTTEGLAPADAAMLRRLSEALSPAQALAQQARVDITRIAFTSLVQHLSGVPGRKNLVWVVSKFPLTYGNSQERATFDEAEVQRFNNRLTEANITLYPVDPGGTGDGLGTTGGTPSADTPAGGGRSKGGGGGTLSSKDISAGYSSSLTGTQSFQKFAAATGGKTFRNSNDIGPALEEVIQSGAFSYTLGFYPEEKSLDDKVHKIEVKMVKKPELEKAKLSFRKEYVAWGPQSGPEVHPKAFLGEAAGDSIDFTAIGLVAAAAPDPKKPGYHRLEVRLSIGDMGFKQVADQWTGAFDMLVQLEGQKNGQVEPFNLVWSQQEYLGALQQGLIVGKEIETDGTSGVLHVVVQDKATGAIGSVRVPFSSPKP